MFNAIEKSTAILVPLLVFIAGIFMRKVNWPLASVIIVVGGLWLTFACLYSGIKIILNDRKENRTRRIPDEILLGMCIGLLLFQQQYWLHGPELSRISAILFLILIYFSFLKVRSKTESKFIKSNSLHSGVFFLLSIVISVLLITGLFLNPRQFHNFYRQSTYEEFLRSRFPQVSIPEATALLGLYSDHSRESQEKSNEFYSMALKMVSEKKFENALRLYNLSIDKNPNNADAYFHRGYLKLYHLELNKGIANSAVIDFSESIRLRPTHADSYFQRGVSLGYLDAKKRVCVDMRIAHKLDSTLDVEPFMKKFCRVVSTGSDTTSHATPHH
ncbi:MAG: hypothetical protein KA444_04715 [Bacteroidia bacterium]|nr:hypothetical protein [Bacteroidia bacterium]